VFWGVIQGWPVAEFLAEFMSGAAPGIAFLPAYFDQGAVPKVLFGPIPVIDRARASRRFCAARFPEQRRKRGHGAFSRAGSGVLDDLALGLELVERLQSLGSLRARSHFRRQVTHE
jgi:hypothetical protein